MNTNSKKRAPRSSSPHRAPAPAATQRPCITARSVCGAGRINTNPAIGQRDRFTVTGAVRLTDLVGFAPTPGVDHMEPAGWSIVGLDTNFFATTADQEQTGTLLGRPASVRFTPTGFHWNYGDGTSASLVSAGLPWRQQGVASFDPTPTSHRYDRVGRYTIDLTIEFAAEYRYLLADWLPIPGRLSVPANRLVTTMGTAKTVLVERNCLQDPRGPGC